MKLVLLAVVLVTAALVVAIGSSTGGDTGPAVGITPRGVGVVLGEDLCLDAATGMVTVCVEL